VRQLAISTNFGAVIGVGLAVVVIWLGLPPIYVLAAGVLFLVTWPALCVRFYAPTGTRCRAT
jgi:hypothetical protein